ncbi:MAG: cytochrome-c oxidase, cbb3-type subunit II [Campylobacteraceae bacterium]|jgi:cytochrome c oxidase cbb3-type subunit 2|nr:cytochrome-c oxidase, cbb3-type subunit II [Campylobacteraceae bacterium]
MFSWLEKNPFFFAVVVFVVIAYAGIVEILPSFVENARPVEGTKPYTVLELAGKNIYIKENCNGCHSQMIRPFKSETDRYGKYSLSGEYAYDRPFLWGSKRTGPDLMRVGNSRSSDWHDDHMRDPSAYVQGSIMPAYKHLYNKVADLETAYAEAYTVKTVFNTPYDKEGFPKLGTWEYAKAQAEQEAEVIVDSIRGQDVKDAFAKGEILEIVALIAYLNSLK